MSENRPHTQSTNPSDHQADGLPKTASFCTCSDLDCPLHPTRHDRGCSPCIQKNLRQREIPNCFFNLAGRMHAHKGGYTFEDFARLVLGPKD